MVVYKVVSTVDVGEHCNFSSFVAGGDVENVGGDDVEVACVPAHLLLEFLDNHAEMT